MSLSDEDLAKIKERAEKATPGPWTVRVEGDHPFDGGENCGEIAYMGDDGGDGPCVHVSVRPGVEAADTIDDAAFVAHARQDVPDLLAEVARLRDQVRTAATTLGLAVIAADESVRTIADDADAASTAACTLRSGAAATLKQLGAEVVRIEASS